MGDGSLRRRPQGWLCSGFSFDITELVKDGENELTVKVEDSFDIQQPRGKQRWIDENFGCWYVQTTGIWKTVWTEYVPKIRLDHVKMTPNLHDMALELEYQLDVPEVNSMKILWWLLPLPLEIC